MSSDKFKIKYLKYKKKYLNYKNDLLKMNGGASKGMDDEIDKNILELLKSREYEGTIDYTQPNKESINSFINTVNYKTLINNIITRNFHYTMHQIAEITGVDILDTVKFFIPSTKESMIVNKLYKGIYIFFSFIIVSLSKYNSFKKIIESDFK